MLSRRSFLTITAGLAAAPTMIAAAAEESLGLITALKGKAVALNVNERMLNQGDAVQLGDLLQTSSNSRLTLRLGQSTVINLGPSTKLRIERHLADAGGEFELVEGRMFFEHTRKPGSAPSKTEVRSPYGLLAVRGTRFYAGPSLGAFGVFVAEGRVDVSAAGKIVPVLPGFGSEISKPGQAPKAAVRWKTARIRQALRTTTGKSSL